MMNAMMMGQVNPMMMNPMMMANMVQNQQGMMGYGPSGQRNIRRPSPRDSGPYSRNNGPQQGNGGKGNGKGNWRVMAPKVPGFYGGGGKGASGAQFGNGFGKRVTRWEEASDVEEYEEEVEEDEDEEEVEEEEAAPASQSASRDPLNKALWNRLRKVLPTSKFRQNTGKCINALKSLASDTYRGFSDIPEVLVFGSKMQETMLEGSDLDVSFQFLSCGRDAKDQIRLLSKLRNVVNNKSKNRNFKRQGGFRVKEARLYNKIRVPIVILEWHIPGSNTPIEVDVSAGNRNMVGTPKGFTDSKLCDLLQCDRTKFATHAVQFVKYWAKSSGLNDASQGFFNSLGWTLVTVMALQNMEKLPSIQDMENENYGALSTAPVTLVQVLSQVLDLIDWIGSEAPDAERNKQRLVLSARTGSTDRVAVGTGEAGSRSVFCIEDPGAMMSGNGLLNVARALRPEKWEEVLNKCRSMRQMLDSGNAGVVSRLLPKRAW